MKLTVKIVLIVLITILSVAKCSRILGFFPVPGRSHYTLGNALLRELAERGHDVTMISPFSEKVPPKNGTYRDIVIKGLYKEIQKIMDKEVNIFDTEGTNPFTNVIFTYSVMFHFIEKSFQEEEVQKLINSNEKFDVVIIEQFANDAQKALAAHFEAQLIIFTPIDTNHWINPLVGNPSPPSYIPEALLPYSSKMTFWERLVNSFMYIYNEAIFYFYLYPKQNEFIKKFIPNGPDVYDVLYNNSLVLINSHPSLNEPVPYVPNMINIGGFHIKPPKKLPSDLQEFLDNAKEGVIYFSMGSNLKSAQFPPEKRDAFLKTFSKLKQKVLWKWEEKVLPGQSPNVKTAKWLPQQDILAHPNVKLFITHGGFLSTTETIYHGVPILAIPIFGDQETNARLAVNNGFGLMLPYQQITETSLTKSVSEILTNPKYKENAKRRSEIFHDRQVSPMDTAIYWVEYVIRHRGAPHLRVAALDLPWYKYHLLDVISFIIGFSFIAIYISCWIIKAIYRKLLSKNKSNKIKKS